MKLTYHYIKIYPTEKKKDLYAIWSIFRQQGLQHRQRCPPNSLMVHTCIYIYTYRKKNNDVIKRTAFKSRVLTVLRKGLN